MLFVLNDKSSKLYVGYMMIGSLVCLIAGALNNYVLALNGNDILYVTTVITPITEEIMKAIPVLYLAIFFTDKRETLISASFSLGVGFAILEDAVILAQNIKSLTLAWALARVVGAALMHGASTAMIGLGMSYVHKRKKLFFCGTFALLITSVMFHATFNVLVQSSYRIAAFLLPAAIYIPVLIHEISSRRKAKKTNKA